MSPSKTDTRPARGKIKTLEQLGEIAAEARKAGGRVVLAHGVFDLLHMGHVRHLEVAREQGSVLIVTVTADAFVNKGPGRPVFPDYLRAEFLASLEYVDWVGINHDPSAEAVLRVVRPDVYVKGSDYRNSKDDITGKIAAERETVESHGGSLIFTDDITFSSSALINRYLNVYEPSLQQYLDVLRDQGALQRLTELLERIKDYRVLFVGDAIIDEYQYVLPMGKSPKENMIATLFQGRELFAGGVFAAANHVAGFCRQVEVLTILGDRDSHESLIRDAIKPNVVLNALRRPNTPTTRKCRFIDPTSLRKMFEVYFMDDTPVRGKLEEKCRRYLGERMADFDLVVVTDFGHGFLTPGIVSTLTEKAPFLAVNCQSNSANHGFNLITKYSKADFVCIDSQEARLAVHDKYLEPASIVQDRLPTVIDCSRFVVTQGKAGCLAYSPGEELCKVPALTNSIVDTVGAGDAFFSVTAPLAAAGASMADIGLIGNAAGAMKVGIVGHRSSVEKVPLLKFLTALLK
ncbi:MAG: adenylyltransferase/cytidyltransferase family protein [Alphaproteobacteria bacterium]|nr:adenylyltransferase/cytidyltransferase family protein [Alphaproteobacteria bacterium]